MRSCLRLVPQAVVILDNTRYKMINSCFQIAQQPVFHNRPECDIMNLITPFAYDLPESLIFGSRCLSSLTNYPKLNFQRNWGAFWESSVRIDGSYDTIWESEYPKNCIINRLAPRRLLGQGYRNGSCFVFLNELCSQEKFVFQCKRSSRVGRLVSRHSNRPIRSASCTASNILPCLTESPIR
jgi:hypothetical protein